MAQKSNPKKTVHPPIKKAEPAKKKNPGNFGISSNAMLLLLLAFVALVGYIVYSPSLANSFTNWDDPGYLTQNKQVRDWTKAGINHLFKSDNYIMGNYHPLTMLSLAWEYHVAALKPYIYHRDSMWLHIFTSLVVTWLAWLLSRRIIIAAICGLLFVIHPMHVESVAWVAGRKDVLFGLFYFLSLIGYYFYCTSKDNKVIFYIFCFLLFVISGLSKGVAVTLPVSCLLIDYYLGRALKINLLMEKIPLFIVSIVLGIISIKAQSSAEAIQSTEIFPVFDRIFFASYAFVAYIGKLILPVDLCNFYPYPIKTGGQLPAIWYIYPIIVIALLFVIYKYFRKNKDVVFGFLFYCTAIFLLLQLLPVGTAIIADRYSYIAYFGLFFIMGYAVDSVLKIKASNMKSLKPIIPAIVLGWIIWLGVTTRARCEVWKNTETLWRDAIEKQPDQASSYNNLGFELYKQGKNDEALPLFSKAIELNSSFELPYGNRGEIYRLQGKNDLALADFNKAISLKPTDAGPYLSRAILYCIRQKLDSAGADFDLAVKLDPNMAEIYASRGNYYDMKNMYEASIADYSKAIELKPELAEPYQNRAAALIRHKQYDAAISDLNVYLQLKPEAGDGYFQRSEAYYERKDYKNALSDAVQAQTDGYALDANYLQQLKKANGQ